MSKSYAFSQNEYLSVHPLHLHCAVTELEACRDMLQVLSEYAESTKESGLANIIGYVIERLEDTEQKLTPEAVQERFDKIQKELCHAN